MELQLIQILEIQKVLIEFRSAAMDLLGLKKQLVFATHSVAFPFHPSSKKDPVLRYGATRAHNRHMLDFCSADSRLMGVGVVPLDDPARAIEEVDWAIKEVLQAIWIPHRAPIDRSPGHVELEGFWARGGSPGALRTARRRSTTPGV